MDFLSTTISPEWPLIVGGKNFLLPTLQVCRFVDGSVIRMMCSIDPASAAVVGGPANVTQYIELLLKDQVTGSYTPYRWKRDRKISFQIFGNACYLREDGFLLNPCPVEVVPEPVYPTVDGSWHDPGLPTSPPDFPADFPSHGLPGH